MGGPIRNYPGHVVTTLLALGGAVAVLLGFLVLGGNILKGETTTVRAIVPTSSALGKGAKVAMAGAQVGRVAKVSRRGSGTLVEMEITDASVVPVPADSRVTLRQRTPVGENYIEITPGRATAMLGGDDVLPVTRSDEYVDVDQILSVLDGKERAAARQLIQGAGRAVDGQGRNLNVTLGEASKIVVEGGTLFGVLSEDRAQVARLVDRLGRVSAAVGERGAAVRTTAERGLVALDAVAARDDQLAATLRELPATLGQVRETSLLLRSTATTATPVVQELAATVGELRRPVGNLRPAMQQARNVVKELGLAASPLRTTLRRVDALSAPLVKALPQLHKTICQVAPIVRYTAPYTKDAIATVVGLGSASNSYDAVGHLIRLTPIVGENSLAGAPDAVTEAAYTLLRTGLLGKSSPLTWNPIPEPGQIGKATATGVPAISGQKALKDSGYVYPRILADC